MEPPGIWVYFMGIYGIYGHFPVYGGTPKSSILMGFSIINQKKLGVSPFLETPIL
jgi:hypothetical protein